MRYDAIQSTPRCDAIERVSTLSTLSTEPPYLQHLAIFGVIEESSNKIEELGAAIKELEARKKQAEGNKPKKQAPPLLLAMIGAKCLDKVSLISFPFALLWTTLSPHFFIMVQSSRVSAALHRVDKHGWC